MRTFCLFHYFPKGLDLDLTRILDNDKKFLVDAIGFHDEESPITGDWVHHPIEQQKKFCLPSDIKVDLLHHLFMKDGKIVTNENFGDWRIAQEFCKPS